MLSWRLILLSLHWMQEMKKLFYILIAPMRIFLSKKWQMDYVHCVRVIKVPYGWRSSLRAVLQIKKQRLKKSKPGQIELTRRGFS